jgi:hypothetical protein
VEVCPPIETLMIHAPSVADKVYRQAPEHAAGAAP